MASLNVLRRLAGSKDEEEWFLIEIHYIDDGKEEKCKVTIMHDGIEYTIDALQYPDIEPTTRELILRLAKGAKDIISAKQKQEQEQEEE